MAKKISIIMGSKSDLETVQPAIDLLKKFRVGFEVKVLSAHRTPEELERYIAGAVAAGTGAFIAAAGGSAALAGVVASHTIVPVIGIPVETRSLKGLDSLLSTVQMPPGVPVASMAIGKAGAGNAALFALEILAGSDSRIRSALLKYRRGMRLKIKKIKIKI